MADGRSHRCKQELYQYPGIDGRNLPYGRTVLYFLNSTEDCSAKRLQRAKVWIQNLVPEQLNNWAVSHATGIDLRRKLQYSDNGMIWKTTRTSNSSCFQVRRIQLESCRHILPWRDAIYTMTEMWTIIMLLWQLTPKLRSNPILDSKRLHKTVWNLPNGPKPWQFLEAETWTIDQ